MALDETAVDELKSLIGVSRKRDLNFGLCLGSKPEDTQFILHRMKAADVLEREAKRAGDTTKSASGVVRTEGKVLMLRCAEEPPAGMARKMRQFLNSVGQKLKVQVMDAAGTILEEDGDEEAEAGTSGGGGGEGPAPTSGEASVEDPNKAKWEQVSTLLGPKVATAASQNANGGSLRAAWALAMENAGEGDYVGALKIAARLATALSGPATGHAVEGTNLNPDAARWKLESDKMRRDVEAALANGRGEPGKIRAVWDFAQGKAAAQDYAAALRSLEALRGLVTAAGLATETEAQATIPGNTVSDRLDAVQLVDELKSRVAKIKEAMENLPKEAVALKGHVETVRALAQGGDLGAGRTALAEIDRLVVLSDKVAAARLAFHLAEGRIGSRAAAMKDLQSANTVLAPLLSAYREAAQKAIDAAEAKDWLAAEAALPDWERKLDVLERAYVGQFDAKVAYEEIAKRLAPTLAQALKLGAVTSQIGDLCRLVREQDALLKQAVTLAGTSLDYAPAFTAVQELERRVETLLAARKTYVEKREEWGALYGGQSSRIAQIEGCGPLTNELNGLKQTFDTHLAEARRLAKANDYPGALAKLKEVTSAADAFLEAKARYNSTREGVFEEGRKEGKTGIPTTIPTIDRDGKAVTGGVELAMANDKSLATSKGLQAILLEAKVIEGLFADVIDNPDASVIRSILTPLQNVGRLCDAYQRDHKADARSKDDRAKFAQAETLRLRFEAMAAELRETALVADRLGAIDPKALATDEAGALKAIGAIDFIKTLPVGPKIKAAAEAKRRALVALMMKAATTPDRIREVAMMAGGDVKASYERQLALGPLSKTAGESRASRDEMATRIRPPKDAENVDRTNRLAARLITPDGRLELSALYACDPKGLAGDSPSSRQTARALTRLREDPEAIAILEGIEAPKKDSPAARMVRATLGLPADAEVTPALARQAALASMMAELRQKDIGSCFATQVAITIHDTDPKAYLRDISDMMSKGAISREVNGETITIPVETIMSDAALETSTVKLSRGDNPDLKGSSTGGEVAEKTKLEEAPAFQAVFGTLGVAPDDRAAAMAKALKTMQASDEFKKNQNLKALREAVAEIDDEDTRKKVFHAAVALLGPDPASVKVALQNAMAAEGVDDGTGGTDDERGAALGAFDAVGAAADFDVEPGLIVRQIVMDKIGLTDAEIAKQDQYEKAAAALARDTRPETDPGRISAMRDLERLQNECATIRPKILKMGELKAACYDVYTGGEDNRLLRSYEYTLTALAEKGDAKQNMQKLQEKEQRALKSELTKVVNDMTLSGTLKISDSDLSDMADKIFDRYQELFVEATAYAYSATISTGEIAADGNSSGGGKYLYDRMGIPDPANWIKIESQKQYATLVAGLMLRSSDDLYSKADPAEAETARSLAETLAEKVGSEDFAKKVAAKATSFNNNEPGALPWEIQDGGDPHNILQANTGRAAVVTSMGKPTDSKDLIKKVGTQLKALWTGDPALRSAADNDPEVATVTVMNKGVHAFSLLPGDPKLRSILESANVGNAIDAHEVAEKQKWDGALTAIAINSKEELRAFMEEYRCPTNGSWVDDVWADLENNAYPKTGKGVMKCLSDSVVPAEKDKMEERIGGAVAKKLVPPVAPAALQGKLEKAARKLNVPDDMIAAVTKRAKDALDAKDATKATMGDIQVELTKAMTAEGLDGGTVDKKVIADALREPAGLVFADSNWGDAEHRIKFQIVVNPVSGKMEMWQTNEDGTDARKLDDDEWVKMKWSTVT